MGELVNIVIPVYNGEKYLRQTIESCLKQNYENINIIIVNDASPDQSVKIINDYIDFNKIKVITNKKNMGLIRTVNIGSKAAKGKYLMVLGQDDILPDDYIENALLFFQEDTAFVYCNPVVINQYGNRKKKLRNETEIKYGYELLVRMGMQNEIMSTGLIMDLEKFISVGGYEENYRNYGEWYLWIKLLAKGKAVYMKNISSLYRRHQSNISNEFTKKDYKTQKQLHEYWQSCRNYAIKNLPYKTKDRYQLIWYMLIQYLKDKLEEALILLKKI